MLTKDSRRFRRLLGHPTGIAPALCAIVALAIGAGLASPVRGDEGAAPTQVDRAALSEIAQNVLRRAAAGPDDSVPEETLPVGDIADPMAGPAEEPDPDSPVRDMAPAREGILVPIPPEARAAAQASREAKAAPTAKPDSYRSNSWRRRLETGRALGFSSGVLAPSSGLDPALKTRAEGLRAQGDQVVYGFILLRVTPDEALEKELARLGVELLGRHDDHHKARIPVAALDAVAALPEVEWVGTSPPELKQSSDLADLRDPGTKSAIGPATPIPVSINLFEGDEDGRFRRQLEALGAVIGEYDRALQFYRAVATGDVIDRITALDFVLFVEPIGLSSANHDESTPLVDADIIRPGTSFGHTRYSGASTLVGILDSGFMAGGNPTPSGAVGHSDLHKMVCGRNFTTDTAGVFNDEAGHGTHVLATIAGTGTANPRFRGVATGVGTLEHIRAAKIWKKNNKGDMAWMEQAMDFMASFGECASAPPEVINISGGQFGIGLTGTDTTSRKLDDMVWTKGQLYVVSAGNDGPTNQTIGRPAVAKNALTVGNVFDSGYLAVGDITTSSSRGPTGDFRMKPNLVAPGHFVTSADAGTTTSYAPDSGTSMAAPHVTGIAATLMEHDYQFKGRPAMMRAHLMATALAHDGVYDNTNVYGLGRVSSYVAHWDHPNDDGWFSDRHWGTVNSNGFAYADVVVPQGAERLVVVMTWDEPAASSGASRAVTYDVDLWLDRGVDCGDPSGRCGEFASLSNTDNVEYIVLQNPPAGTYRMKVTPTDAPTFPLRWGMTALVIRGDATPSMNPFVTAPASAVVGSEFDLAVSLGTPSYIASGVQVEPVSLPSGVTLLGARTQRLDGLTHTFYDKVTLGNLTPMLGRTATWKFRADTTGTKTFTIRAWSENAGELVVTKSIQVTPQPANLVPAGMTTNPPAPAMPPGSSFSVTGSVQNVETGPAGSSRTRYYLSLDAAKSADDTLLGGSHATRALDGGESHSANAKLKIPASTPLETYSLLACADDLGAVEETDEDDNCIAGPTVIVGAADLVEGAISAPPATRARGKTFSVTDTVQNVGAVASGSSKTRYYLSLDAVKSAGDTLLSRVRSVPALAAGASHSRTTSVKIPSSIPLGSYFLLACADGASSVAEIDETNNCTASSTKVAVTP